MKVKVILFYFLGVSSFFAQENHALLKLSNSDGLTFNDELELYSDSTFLFSYGSDTYKNFCTGKYERKGDDILLFPNEKFLEPTITKYRCKDTLSMDIAVTYLDRSNEILDLNWNLLNPGRYKELKDSLSGSYFYNLDESIFENSQITIINIDTNFQSFFAKNDQKPLELVCLGIQSLYSETPIYIIDKDICKVDVQVNLPHEYYIYIHLNGFLRYVIPKQENWIIEKQKIKIKSP